MQHIRRLAMLSLCITHITPTFAAGRDFSTDELLALSLEDLTQVQVSIATGTPKSSYSAPAVTSVIDAKTIADLGLQSIDEALQTLPNVHVSRGSFQYAPRYFIRGIASTYNPHTLVLVNGIPMTSLFLGDRGERIPNAYSLPIELVDRIEVIRGAGSALYGADAFAGVINIHTKNPRDIKNNQASLTVGSFATGRANLLQRQQWQDNSALLSLNYYQSDGDSPIIQRDIQSNYDELFQPYPAQSLAPAAASLSARYFNAHLDLQAPNYRLRSAWLKAWNTGTGVGINDNLDPDARFNHHRASFDLSWQGGHYLGWQLSPQLSYLYGDYENPSSIYLFPKGAFAGLFPDGMIGQPSVKEENARFHLSALTEQL
ncbi:TonB-dependent receptor [Agitococcus lubricus]|uniref:TonB-dependent receptor-like protein n=1 Tax=Agitococcus lubricus TaxID=1077255 RepID=A0A2T5IV83_9GAMM|nr:TonB-dependent receptor plug domain-containing protein [Agitococcus lubricus]PTQ87727.1 TonB-dependent receptor-like protein [Agitococcus lubricus]